MEDKLTFGDRLADKIAAFGGSWSFILIFFMTIIVWMVINIYVLARPFDPYPFILLNLILSCTAAIQAPIIMMSQNRANTIDRKTNELDYAVDLKTEAHMRELHVKLDKLAEDIAELKKAVRQIEQPF